MTQKALIAGATGLVGKQLVKLLLNDERFGEVIAFTRRKTGLTHPKLTEHLVNFDQPEQWTGLVQGDVLFSALGTTLKAAGSKEKQYQVDFTYQYELAKAAAGNGVPAYVLVSSVNADKNSKLFYSRLKGELDDAVRKLGFAQTIIFRPSFLDGQRQEKRKGEAISLKIVRWLTKYLFKRYRPIKDVLVGQAMINSYFMESPALSFSIYEADEIFKLVFPEQEMS